MPAPADLVHQTSSSTGTGNLTLAAVNGKRDFATVFSTGGTDVFDYFISNRNAAEWEVGTGHMSDSTTLVRDTVVRSSNSNSAVSFTSGTLDVTNDVPADDQLTVDDIGVTVQGYDADLAALAGLSSTGMVARTGSGTVSARTITGTSNEISVSNGDGVSGAPTLSLPSSLTLTGKTVTGGTYVDPAIAGTITEDVYTITDGAGFAINPRNGSVQTVTLGASRTPTVSNFNAGDSVIVGIDDGSAYTITWTTIGVTWVTDSGSAPTLATTGYTWIALWKVGSTYYGARVGNNT